MKHSGLMLTSLALCCSVANAASESTFSGNTLHIPHVMYEGAMFDVTMTYQAPDLLLLSSITPLETMPTDIPAVIVSESLKFKLVDIAVGGASYRADVKFEDGQFKVSGIATAIHGKMLKGDNITALGYLVDGSFSYAYSISDDGTQIVGRSRNADRKTVPIRFHFEHGHLEGLNVFDDGRDAARAVNNEGALAGFGTIEVAEGQPRTYNAFYNKSGADLVNLGTLGGNDSRAYGINNSGMIVGWSASKADNTDHVAFSYDTSSMSMTPLGGDILGGERSFAFDINDSGQIAGVATTSDGSAVAFLYENGSATNLGSLDDSGYSEARAINDKGHTTGWSLTSEGKYAAFVHNGSSMTKLPNLGGDTKAYDINTHGHVVGDARDADDERHAFIYKDGELKDLYGMLLAADQANWEELREAYSISDDGTIVGRGRYWKDKANDKSTSMAFRIKF